ncbi:MAG: DNA-processing protein DprA [Coriobacteriia bacterium]|nr:DNA-processing protein DprA [Coriobacteriia bacterium]
MSASRFELHLGEPGYPAHLALSPRPPRHLFVMGDPAALVPGLAVIGSRKATPYGLACAKLFAGWAAGCGVTIVSGAAIGCDQAAQTAALAAGGRSIAVLGCGADIDYPYSSRTLLRELRDGAGAVVSEFPWGMPVRPGHFPARNRIIAGLSQAVLVVEAAMPSGTFSTADHALDADRTVLAVPGSVLFSGSAGCNRLLRQGAGLVACVEDLADELASAGLIDHLTAGASRPAPGAAEKGEIGTADPVLRAVQADPMSPDAIARHLDLPAHEALRRLAVLEARGWIERFPDGRYGPCRSL